MIKGEKYPSDSPELADTSLRLCKLCNSYAMTCLQKQQFKMAMELLRKAEMLTSNYDVFEHGSWAQLRAVTFSNMGCLCKERGELHAALRFLKKALKIESARPNCDNPARTFLNICAVQSLLGLHRAALKNARIALELILREDHKTQNKDETNERPLRTNEDSNTPCANEEQNREAVDQRIEESQEPHSNTTKEKTGPNIEGTRETGTAGESGRDHDVTSGESSVPTKKNASIVDRDEQTTTR